MPITSPGNDDDTGENHQPTLRKNTAEPVEQTLKQNTKPIIPLETRLKAIEPVPGSVQKRAAKQLGAGVGAVHGWVRAYRKGGMAALQSKNRNAAQGNKPADSRRRPSAADDDDAEALRRRVEEPEPGERVDAGGGGGSQKKTPAPTCGACRTGRRPC